MEIKELIATLAAFFSIPTHANSILLGDFGHDFSGEEDRAVWRIRKKGSSYSVEFKAVQQEARLRYFSDAEIAKLWQKFSWPEYAREGAVCLGNDQDIFFYVPKEQRAMVGWLAESASDFFYYSAMAGVMEIHKVGTHTCRLRAVLTC